MRDEPPADLLLLNASNYPKVAIFPYAFVQVSEVARRHGLRVAVHDLLGTPPELLDGEIERLLERHRPRAVGLHLRQTDSLLVEDYRAAPPAADPPFFPVEATRTVIARVRDRSRVPIVVGGHGFSSNPKSTFARLEVDLGVVGDPDGFFARFDDALAGRNLEAIPNLIHRSGGRVAVNAREFYAPAARPEYTVELMDEVRRFYGTRALLAQAIPVEVMRGCPYSCYFCVEPAIKGRSARVRDLDVVMEDVEFIVGEGMTRFWMVCSELNVFGPGLALDIAERMIRLAERTRRPLRWHAFNLPVRLGPQVWRTLIRSGFRGGFNTYMSLDEENLRRGRIPHRVEDALAEYVDVEEAAGEAALVDAADAIRSRGTLALLFGNPFATTDTIRRSLAALAALGLLEKIRLPKVIAATRIFEVLERDEARDDGARIRFGEGDGTLAQPTFEYPRALLDHFGGIAALESFFGWLETTVLSRQFEGSRDWALFLANATTPARLAALCARHRTAIPPWLALPSDAREALHALLDAPSERALTPLFLPPPSARKDHGVLALAVLTSLFDREAEATSAVLLALGLEGPLATFLDAPILGVLASLYARFPDGEAAVAAVRDALDPAGEGIETLCGRFLLYRRNLVINQRYASALFEPAPVVRLPLVEAP
jgi:hypothetical protein